MNIAQGRILVSIATGAAFFVLWFFCVPATVYLRDAPEFVLATYFGDVVHPAGSPTYVSLGNLFALFPFGPISWRVNLFSLFSASTVVSLASLVVQRQLAIRLFWHRAFSAIFLVASFSIPFAYLRQSMTAEVYMLNAAFLLGVFELIVAWREYQDSRFGFLAAFVAGLAMGNHAVCLIPLAVMAIWALLNDRIYREKSFVIITFVTLGLGVYLSLPLRATKILPLNTGDVSTFSSFINHITDARDRELRNGSTSYESNPHVMRLRKLNRDLSALGSELSIPILLFACLGAVILCLQRRFEFLTLGSAALAWIAFFSGWSPDPWVFTIAVLLIFSNVFVARMMQVFSHRPLLMGCTTFLALLLCADRLSSSWSAALDARDSQYAENRAKKILALLPSQTVFLAETNWFSLRALSLLYGYRSDVALLYTPGLTYPKYFGKRELRFNGERFDLDLASDSRQASFFNTVARAEPLFFDSSSNINKFLGKVIRIDQRAIPYISPNQSGSLVVSGVKERYLDLFDLADQESELFHEDSLQIVQAEIYAFVEMLVANNEQAQAVELLKQICLMPNKSTCGVLMLNNLSAYALGVGEFGVAIEAAQLAISSSKYVPESLHANLSIAQSRLAKEPF